MKTWIKDNLRTVLLVGLILICFFFLRKWGTGYFESKREIKALSDSIAELDRQYLWMQDQLSSSTEVSRMALNEAELIRDSLRNAERTIRTNTIRHENEIANLTRIPTDSLYLGITTWLDSLSFD